MAEALNLSSTANSMAVDVDMVHVPVGDFLEQDVGWFYYNGEFRLLQPFMKWSFLVLGRSGIESPMSIALIPLVFYFLSVSLFTLFDLYGTNWHWIQKYKLQSKPVNPKTVVKAVKLTMWNQLVLIAPILMMQYITGQPEIKAKPLAPTVFELVGQLVAMFVLFDFQYYVWHYVHHKSRRLYKWCHIVHHEFHSPSAWSAQYLHPWELFCIGVYNGVLPSLFDAHWLTMNAMSLVNVYASILDHCGYDLPIDFSHWLPFYGGARKHDMHHMKPFTNFQPHLSTFDILLGDECPGLLPGHQRPKELLEWEEKREKQALEWYKDMPVKSIEKECE